MHMCVDEGVCMHMCVDEGVCMYMCVDEGVCMHSSAMVPIEMKRGNESSRLHLRCNCLFPSKQSQ